LSLSENVGIAPHLTKTLQVVGVVREAKSSSMVDGISRGFVYVPMEQQALARGRSTVTIVARSTHGQRIADALRVTVASMNPNLTIVSSQTLEDSVALGFVSQRVAASIAGSLGLVGLLLAAVGIYGVTAFAVACRLREFGIRLALGATRADIIRLVLWQGLSLTTIGCAIGLTLGVGAGKIFAGFLFGLPPLDPVTFIGAAALFATIGLIACYAPARRATKADPLATLRHE
jgi:putative ABC transport system permease protein